MNPASIFGRLLIIPPVLLGIAVVVYMVRSGGEPARELPTEKATPARVIAVPAVDFVPRATGFGSVQPGRVWEAVAEVGGRIVEKHPSLESGELMPGGTLILRIDPTDYRLALESAEARIRGAEAQIAELDIKEGNTHQSLAIEQRALELAERDLERKKALLARGSVAQATVDEAERNVLSLRQAVQGQQSQLAAIPAEREVLVANLALYQSDLAQAERNLERTEITTPFDGRVADVAAEERQFAPAGKVLAVIDGLDLAEVSAQITLDRIRPLLEASDVSVIDVTAENVGRLFDRLRLEAVVRLHAGEMDIEWPARFSRIRETVDPRTRTIGVVVAVDEPYRQARPGQRPPLAKNMFVEVELRGPTQPDRIIVPRSAVHGSDVYVIGDDNRLVRRSVRIGFRQGDLAVIEAGLAAGERIVVGDLVPAIDGMLLAPVTDEAELAALIAAAGTDGARR